MTAVQLGLGCLEEIYEVGGSVELLLTLSDDVARDKSGRVFLDTFAADHDVALAKVRNINDPEALRTIQQAELDWLFVIGWSQIARREVLDSTTHGCIGMHPTLLPKGRGRASIPWAILKGLPETGVTMFKLDEGVDTGPILGQQRIAVSAKETATSLYAKVAREHRELMGSAFPKLQISGVNLTAQDEAAATVWAGRTRSDGCITNGLTIEEIDRLVRATTHPYPGAYVARPNGSTETIWSGSRHQRDGAVAVEALDGTFWATETEERV